MKTRVAIIFFAISFLLRPMLQVFLPEWMTLDLCLCIYIAMAVTMDKDSIAGPMIAAFVFMVISDIIFSQYVGVTPLAMLATTGFIFALKTMYDVENKLMDIINMVLGFLVFHSAYWLIYKLLGSPYSFLYMLGKLPWLLLTESVITGIIILLIVRAKIQKRRYDYFK